MMRGDRNKRTQPRYPGIHKAKNTAGKIVPGVYRIVFTDWQGKRRTQTHHGGEASAARVKRNILAAQDEIRAGLKASPRPKTKVTTLGQLWEAFKADRELSIREGSMTEGSLDRNWHTYRALLNYDPSLEHRRLDKITKEDIKKFKIHRLEEGFAPEGVNTNLRGLRTIFNFAVYEEFLKKSPMKKVEAVKVTQRDARLLNDAERLALRLAMESLDLTDTYQKDAHDLTLFYLHTGCRRADPLFPNFTWEDVGPEIISLRQVKTGKVLEKRKSETIRDILESRRGEPNGPFNLSGDEAYLRVKWLMDRAELDASPKDLRSTAGSRYYLATRDIFATSRFLGHSSVKVTERHYMGLIQSLELENHEKFENLMKSDLLFFCYSERNHAQSRATHLDTKNPSLTSEKGASRRAGPTRLELATSGLTGRRSNQLNYGP